ncbi:hypothetical protein SAMN05421805_102322 [Saccharopolyspora antimicrobica]|uniref:Nucleotidyl transferase AbiEii toxin, Type IV TA system n=1 Tax=Saccharopolyspora antimicrobica TaxID=455193 RepID=A0A1I4VPY3_9PSEU|nr:hypothetical protein [Saccharopolyspora antimicrobica]RKT87265.1 hypothetical protein ATL45_5665 [Saccharopolyspora antimicrobica]SFN03394.1 hypothetical protein SAMN05421805_102322 [Saccharopolyspora antimicrobica]
MTTQQILEREARTRSEADALVAELGLEAELSAIGSPTRVGSSALRVMVRRDVDITVTCAELDRATHRAVTRLGAELALHEQVREVRLRDDTGRWNTDPMYPDGLYLNISCRDTADHEWTLDIWFVDEPERQPDLTHLRTLAPRLDDAARAAVLAIKHELATRPEDPIASYEVYRAVLDHGVVTPEEFAAWRARS